MPIGGWYTQEDRVRYHKKKEWYATSAAANCSVEPSEGARNSGQFDTTRYQPDKAGLSTSFLLAKLLFTSALNTNSLIFQT